MSREVHVRFWERVGVKFPRATRLPLYRQSQIFGREGVDLDRSTLAVSLLSDGLLHSAELLMLAAGFYLFIQLVGHNAVSRLHAWAGLFLGAGAFQLFDGIVDHKVLRLHQVRYVDNLLPYDLAWNGFGVLLLLIGFVLWRQAVGRSAAQRGE